MIERESQRKRIKGSDLAEYLEASNFTNSMSEFFKLRNFDLVLSYAESYPLPAHPNSAEALSSPVRRLINNPREKKAAES